MTLFPLVVFVFAIPISCPQIPPINYPTIFANDAQQNRNERTQKTISETLSLTCYADYPIEWIIPEHSVYHNYSDTMEGFNVDNLNDAYSTITIFDLRTTDTGYYRCVSKNYTQLLELKNEFFRMENRIYVYVKDPSESDPFLRLNQKYVNITDDEVTYVKCLVTDISAKIELYNNKLQKVDGLVYDSGLGFRLQPDDLRRFCQCENEGRFCRFTCKSKTKDGKTHEMPIVLRVLSNEISISPTNLENLFYLGNNLSMICNIENEIGRNYSCTWSDPKQRSKIQGNPVVLPIVNVDSLDEAVYVCNCIDTETGKLVARDISLLVKDTQPREGIEEKLFDDSFVLPQSSSASPALTTTTSLLALLVVALIVTVVILKIEHKKEIQRVNTFHRVLRNREKDVENLLETNGNNKI